MHTIQINQRRSLWSTILLIGLLTFLLAACGTNTGGIGVGGISTGGPVLASKPGATYTTVKGYGTAFGCPSDVVVNSDLPTPDVVITSNQRNTTFTVHIGQVVEIRLPFGQAWGGPTASQGPLRLQTPFGYALQDKHACVWRFFAQRAGTTRLIFTGRAICKPGMLCPLYIIEIPFTIDVR